MRQKLTYLLCICLLLAALAGCGGEKRNLVGTWTGTMDLTQSVGEQVSAALGAELSQWFTVPELKIACTMTFTAKGTYRLEPEEDSVALAVENIRKTLAGQLTAYLEDRLRKQGNFLSAEEYLEAQGTNLDNLLDQAIAENAARDILNQAALSGNFSVKQDKLLLSHGEKAKPDAQLYYSYTLEENTLCIRQGTGDLDFPCPLTLTRSA